MLHTIMLYPVGATGSILDSSWSEVRQSPGGVRELEGLLQQANVGIVVLSVYTIIIIRL